MAKNHSESLIWRNFAPKSTSDYEEAMLLIFGAKIQIF